MVQRWIVMAAAMVLIAAGTAAAQQQIVVSGVVRAEDGSSVSGATVTAEGPTERATITDGTGRYQLGPLPAGRYRIAVRGIGYRPGERQVTLTASTTADFELSAAPISLAPLSVVAATRAATAAASLPVKIDVIQQEAVATQQSLATNPTELLSNLIPSFSPARQKLTSAGESFRGRRPLFLIDGVPQSNPLRDGRRDGFTIDMEAIERVEVIFGANAIQGLGATGGIVNYVTASAPYGGELEQRLTLSTTTSDQFESDGFGWRGSYLIGKRAGAFDFVGTASYEQRGLQYDGGGRTIAIDNVQGDIADSHSRNLFAKIGWEPAEAQRLQLTVNDFELAQEGDYDLLEGDRTLGIPATAVEGDPEGTAPINDVTTVALDYEHNEVAGGSFSAKAYFQDFAALFGGGRFGTFQDPLIAPVGELFDQSENNSEKVGARLTFARADLAGTPVDVVTGFDFLRDRTFQRLVQTDRNWVPETRFFNYAPFAQFDLQALEWLSLSGGFRWEIAELDVADFTTLAGNRSDLQRVEVDGGSPAFDKPLFNVGGVLTPIRGLRVYGTFSQAFTMPDVGRVLRGISQPGTAVEDFLDLQPIKTDNLEIGTTWGTEMALVGATYFESEADFGSRLVPNADGIFQVTRQPTFTSGWEFNGRVMPDPRLTLTAGYSILEGSFDGDDDGEMDSDLGAADIGPDRLNLAADLIPGGRFTGRLQAFHYFDRSFQDADGTVTAEFDGYTTVDASASARLGISTVTFSLSNLLDEDYITYYGQAATNRGDRYFAGRGRTLTLRLDTRF